MLGMVVSESVQKERDGRRKGKKEKEKKRKRHSEAAVASAVDEDGGAAAKPKSKKVRIEEQDAQHQHADVTILRDLASTTTNPFRVVTARLYLPISPLHSLYPWLSLECDHLDPLVLTYYPPLRGVIFAYRNIRFNQKGAKMQADSPFAFTWVTVDFLLWCPKKGDRLEGWVNLQSESHVGLLVLNTFNISVPRGKIPAGWRWCERRVGFVKRKIGEVVQDKDGEEEMPEKLVEEEEEDLGGWVDEDGKYVDGLLGFTVESVKASGHIITIEGNLLHNEDDAGQANSVGYVQTMNLAMRPVSAAPPPIPKEGDVRLEVMDGLEKMERKERERKREKKERKEGREEGEREKRERKERKERKQRKGSKNEENA